MFRGSHRQNFESINLYDVKYDNYIVEGTEGSFTVLIKKNDFSKSQVDLTKTTGIIKRSQSTTISMSKTAYGLPSKEKLDQDRMDAFKNCFLLHKYQKIDQATNTKQMLKEIKSFKDNRHAALAELYRFSMHDPKGEEIPCILTERPINYTLYSFFSLNSANDSMTSDSEISDLLYIDDEINVINERYNTEIFKFTPEHKYLLIVGIVAGIESIHRRGKVHGHLNPRNIYLDENFLPKICGYGFIQPIDCDKGDSDDDDNDIKDFGNLTDIVFIPPEIKKGIAIYQKSDIYSIGMLILYILSEIDPYKSSPKHQKAYQNTSTFPKCISDEWKRIIIRCLENNPKNRINASDLLSKLLIEENINKLVSAIPVFSQDPQVAPSVNFDEYISYIKSHFNIDNDFQDNDIIREMVPDPTALSEEVKSLIYDASKDNPESLLKVGIFFLNGEQNLPKEEENAFELIERSADLGNKEGMKLVAEMYKEGTGTEVDYDKAISYYKKALKNCKDESTKIDIKEKISEIEEMKEKETKLKNTDNNDNDNDEDLKIFDEPDDEKERLNKKVRLQILAVPNKVTKDDIETIFEKYENIDIQMKTHGIYRSAYIYFRNEADKKKFARRYRKKGSNIIVNQCKITFEGLPKTQKEKEEKKKKLMKGMVFGSSFSHAPKSKLESSNGIQKYEIKFNDFYPGKGNDQYTKIGEGSYSYVFKAYRKSDDTILVAKVFKNSFECSSERKNFLREIKALVDIKYPLFIKFYGFNPYSLIEPTKKCATIFLEYIPNCTLNDVIEKECDGESPEWWDNTTKIKTIIGITNAMAYMHSISYIHRDLKPDNIFFDENHEIKIGDFGFSRKYDKKNEVLMTFITVGTPIYNAPEIFMPDNLRYSWEVDVYSFSIILYQILAKKRSKEVYPKVRKYDKLKRDILNGERPKIPNGLNILLVELMKKCWSSLIDERPSFLFIYNFFKRYFEEETPKTTFLPDVNVTEIRNYIAKLDGFYGL